MKWIKIDQDRIQRQAFAEMVIHFQVT